jgi:peroxiredoxin
MSVTVGQQAPDFTIPSSDGEKVEPFQLSKNLGHENIVLAFFPLAFTSVCTNEMCQFRDSMRQLNSAKAHIYGISVDSPYALNAFIKAQHLTFKLLSDFNKEVSRMYGVLHEKLGTLMGVSKRSIFLLDQQGVVRYRWVTEDPKVMPNFTEIQQELEKLQS